MEFASYCWSGSEDGGVWDNAKKAKWILDKGAHGRNMAKGKTGLDKQEAAKCKLCGQIDSQRHMLLQCRGSAVFTPLRERAKDAQATILQKIIQGTKGCPAPAQWIRKALINFRDLCWDDRWEHTERLWLGTWNNDTTRAVSGMEDIDQRVDFLERQAFRKHIKELMDPLRDLSPVLLSARMEAITRKNTAETSSVPTAGNRRRNNMPPPAQGGIQNTEEEVE